MRAAYDRANMVHVVVNYIYCISIAINYSTPLPLLTESKNCARPKHITITFVLNFYSTYVQLSLVSVT